MDTKGAEPSVGDARAAASASPSMPLLRDPRWTRFLVVALFLALVYYFRNLASVLICFVVFERSIGWAADQLSRRTRLTRTRAVSLLLATFALVCSAVLFSAIGAVLPIVTRLREDGVESLRSIFEHTSVQRLRAAAGLESEALSQAMRTHAGTALNYVTSTAHVFINLLVGFVLAVVYLYQKDDMNRWLGTIARRSVPGTILRWFGFVGDAIAVTVRMQVVVAFVSAVLTLPVLIILRLPHIPFLCLLLVVAGLVPVVGNLASGAVLCYVAYSERGAWAVGVFLGVTFLLHKIESYYLNPRLAAQHVALPGIVLIVALVLCEQAFGFIGLFISFPLLFVATRIANEWRDEDRVREAETAAETSPSASDDDALAREEPCSGEHGEDPGERACGREGDVTP
ncbi:MAG: AI-2E family transporter [Myxococcales bacterium]|nr:AI-2E family transporter [Myxococcales bacterium]